MYSSGHSVSLIIRNMKSSSPETASPSEQPPAHELQPNLVLPQENSDDHPLMKKYARISEQALKNSRSDPDDGSCDDSATPIG